MKRADAANNLLTAVVKEEGGPVEKTLTLARGVRIDGGGLADLTEGTPVSVRLSVHDGQTAVAVHIHK